MRWMGITGSGIRFCLYLLQYIGGFCTRVCIKYMRSSARSSFPDHSHPEEVDLNLNSTQVEESCNHNKYKYLPGNTSRKVKVDFKWAISRW